MGALVFLVDTMHLAHHGLDCSKYNFFFFFVLDCRFGSMQVTLFSWDFVTIRFALNCKLHECL